MLGTIAEWVGRGTRGSAAEFELRMRESHKQAFGFALRLTGNRTDAEDLLQEGYVRAFRFFDRYDRGLSFTSWLYRILTNAHIDSLRRKGKLKCHSLDGIESEAVRDVADPARDAAATMQADAFDGPLQTALENLKPEFRIAVLLADVEGMAYEEIAEAMQSNVGTVRSRIHRGRKALRERLLKDAPDRYARCAS